MGLIFFSARTSETAAMGRRVEEEGEGRRDLAAKEGEARKGERAGAAEGRAWAGGGRRSLTAEKAAAAMVEEEWGGREEDDIERGGEGGDSEEGRLGRNRPTLSCVVAVCLFDC